MAKLKDSFKKVRDEIMKVGKLVENKVKEILESQDMRDLADRVEHEVSNIFEDTKESVDKMLEEAITEFYEDNNQEICDSSNNNPILDTDLEETSGFVNSEVNSANDTFVLITGETQAN